MIIESLLIHSYNQEEKEKVYSEKYLPLAKEIELETMVKSFYKSFLNTSKAYDLNFLDSSPYLSMGSFNLLEQSKKDAQIIFNHADELYDKKIIHLIFVLCHDEDHSYYFILEFHPEYLLTQKNDFILENSLVFPKRFSSVKFAFLTDLNNNYGRVKIAPKSEMWFESTFDNQLILNAQSTYLFIKKVNQEINEHRGEDLLMKDIEIKEKLNQISYEFDLISSEDFIEENLGGLDKQERQILETHSKDIRLSEELDLKALRQSRISNYLILESEYGVEIKIPLKELNPNSILEVENNEDNPILLLKNIGKVKVK